MFVVALLGTFPGYWFTVLYIEKIGRFIIQLMGFLMMSIFMLILGIKYEYHKEHNTLLFVILYGLTFFFANFGPNSTGEINLPCAPADFVLPAELFPTRVRSTCHALSAASGKAGAMIGAFVVQSYTLDENVNKIKKAIMVLAFTNLMSLLGESHSRENVCMRGEENREKVERKKWEGKDTCSGAGTRRGKSNEGKEKEKNREEEERKKEGTERKKILKVA